MAVRLLISAYQGVNAHLRSWLQTKGRWDPFHLAHTGKGQS